MSTIDLCVVNYQTPQHLNRMISFLKKDVDPDARPWNLLIADNGGDEESREVIMQHKDVVDAVFFNDNIGYSAACNQLANVSYSPYLALLNSDIWMSTENTMSVVESMEADPTIAIMGPKQCNERGEIVHAGIIGTNDAPKHRGWKVSDQSDTMFKDVIDCVTVSGSAYFVRRSAWNEMAESVPYLNATKYLNVPDEYRGAFLPTPHYFEETFCSYHARHLGHRVVYNGLVTIGHSWHASSPVGGHADRHFRTSQHIFRTVCDSLGISHD